MTTVQQFEVGIQAGQVVAVSYNVTATKAAVAYKDGNLRVFSLQGESSIQGPAVQIDAPPTCVAWAHHEFGEILAVGTASGQLQVWESRPQPSQSGAPAAELHCLATLQDTGCHLPVRCVSFCPKQQGLLVAAGYGDGWLRCWEAEGLLDPQSWRLGSKLQVGGEGQGGCVSFCWRPFTTGVPPMVCTATPSGAAVWLREEQFFKWLKVADLVEGESVTAVHWAPQMGKAFELLATAHGSTVLLHSLTWSGEGVLQATHAAALQHASAVWRVEFNMLGTALATGTRDAKVMVWRPNLVGVWERQMQVLGRPMGGAAAAAAASASVGRGQPPRLAVGGRGGYGSQTFGDMVD